MVPPVVSLALSDRPWCSFPCFYGECMELVLLLTYYQTAWAADNEPALPGAFSCKTTWCPNQRRVFASCQWRPQLLCQLRNISTVGPWAWRTCSTGSLLPMPAASAARASRRMCICAAVVSCASSAAQGPGSLLSAAPLLPPPVQASRRATADCRPCSAHQTLAKRNVHYGRGAQAAQLINITHISSLQGINVGNYFNLHNCVHMQRRQRFAGSKVHSRVFSAQCMFTCNASSAVCTSAASSTFTSCADASMFGGATSALPSAAG